MGKRAKKIDNTKRHFFYLVTDGCDVYVMPEKYPYLFEFTYSDDGIETLYGKRKKESTGIKYDSKKHSIIYQGRLFHLNTYVGGQVWLWTRGEITKRELLDAHEFNRRRYINEQKLEELERLEREEKKREIERERNQESKRKVIEEVKPLKKTFYLILKENPVFFNSKPNIDCMCICTSIENAKKILNDEIVNKSSGKFNDDGSYSTGFWKYYIVEKEIVFDEMCYQGRIE